jgi:hypothetical protein
MVPSDNPLYHRAEYILYVRTKQSDKSQANEREYALNILWENDYPKGFLNNCLKPTVCKKQNNSEGDIPLSRVMLYSSIRSSSYRTNQENLK